MESWSDDRGFDEVRQYTGLPVSAPEIALPRAPALEKLKLSPKILPILNARPQHIIRAPSYPMLYVPPPVISYGTLEELRDAQRARREKAAAAARRALEQADIGREWDKERQKRAARVLFQLTMANIDPLVDQLAVLELADRKAALIEAVEKFRPGGAEAVERRFQRNLKRGLDARSALKRALSSELASWVVRGVVLESPVSGLGEAGRVTEAEAVVSAAGAVLASTACSGQAKLATAEFAVGAGMSAAELERRRSAACRAAERLREGRERTALDNWIVAFALASKRLGAGGGERLSKALTAYFDTRVGRSAKDPTYPLFLALVTAADLQRQGRRRIRLGGQLVPLPEAFGRRVQTALEELAARPGNGRTANFYSRVVLEGSALLGVRLLGFNMTPGEQQAWLSRGTKGLLWALGLGALGVYLYRRTTSLEHLKAPASVQRKQEA